ncbi:MAG: hypothetical protein ACT4PT_05495 [Methanobacteriota archaeon]
MQPGPRIIGVMTEDFEVYYEIVRHLKSKRVPFLSLTSGKPIPPVVGVVITTDLEAVKVDFDPVVVFETPAQALEDAERALSGRRTFQELIVGIDPGDKPGFVVIGDGEIVRSTRLAGPDAVAPEVRSAVEKYWARHCTVRVGHGGGTVRDRIVNGLLPLDVRVELVDESRSTPPASASAEEKDIFAARAIALSPGERVTERRRVRPREGEVADIQRKSRIASAGELTITRELARDVAVGKFSLDEAIRRQRRRAP